ncbi:MAG: hypothetical protein HY422_01685 [Candidatus Komeilibacteria bacterium]|nr:hypothetical protein [Candidatus Komeilibacteria bacterium]
MAQVQTADLADNAPSRCTCNQSHIHWHEILCQQCRDRFLRVLFCRACGGAGHFLVCCCGAQVRKEYRCTVATVALGSHSEVELDLLRGYRDGALSSFGVGRALIHLYDRIRTVAARQVVRMPRLKKVLLRFTIRPAITVLRAKENRLHPVVANAAAFMLFLVGLMVATVLYLLAPRSVRQE